jgi:hypothetical protein
MCKHLGRNSDDKQPIPFEPENREFMDAYFDILHRRLEDDGVDFWVSFRASTLVASNKLIDVGLDLAAYSGSIGNND